MLSIRVRIFLLAAVALTAVITAFVVEYNSIQRKLQLTNNTLLIVNDVASLSKLIHQLQKERGLSVIHLKGHNNSMHTLFMQQRKITESLWSQYASDELLDDKGFSQDFMVQLNKTRQRIDSRTIKWVDMRDFYTSIVQRLLELMILKVASLDYLQDISYDLQSLTYLTISREHLGLIRATFNRVYQSGEFSLDDLKYLSRSYGVFTQNFGIFETISKVHFKQNGEASRIATIKNKNFQSVIQQIDTSLNNNGKLLVSSQFIWWKESTAVIDAMKKIEDDSLEYIKQQTKERNTYFKEYLFKYGVISFMLLLVVALLTAFTVVRILKALSILIQSLKNIEQNQDFSFRINSQSKDEFSQISYSINSLLRYTDKIIKDKDFLATTDVLTGVMNRRSFIEEAEKEIIRNVRYKTPFSLIFCDIDFFKSINDQFGHAVGDEVLRKFALSIKENLRTHDYLCRWGGEEFVILAVENDLDSAGNLAEKLRQTIMKLAVHPVPSITCSFGVAQKEKDETFDQLCERADKALYQAKESGRNKVCFLQ